MQLPPLTPGRLIRRYQRFLADVVLDDGREVTAHCPNTGSMLGLATPGCRIWLSAADSPGRKLAWTWELTEAASGVPVGIHTGRANALVHEALLAGLPPELAGFVAIQREARLGERSRVDLKLIYEDRTLWLEVKNVTAAVQDGVAFFPDAVSTRAVKHLRELEARLRAGDRAALVFCVQRGDVDTVRPADHIDPAFGAALRRVARRGLEVHALGARIGPAGITLDRTLNLNLRAGGKSP
jgi:sugar fermentation stimulation protein A